MDMERFNAHAKERLKSDKDFKVKKLEPQTNCPICFVDLKKKKAAKKCPDCNIKVHEECMRVWLNYSQKKNCIKCRSEVWNLFN